MRIKNVRQSQKIMIMQRIKVNLFFHYLSLLFKKRLDLKHYLLLIKRIHSLFKIFKLNKFYKIGKKVKIDNNLPFYPTETFYKYMDRFVHFKTKIPCTSVLLSITKDCSFNCKHCYQKHDKGPDIDINELTNIVPELISHGITNFKIEGGDPFIQFDRLKNLCTSIGFNGEIVINSSGNGITLEKLKILKECCNLKTITFSVNSPIKEDVNFFMGQDYAWNTLQHGLKLCKIALVPASLNCCLHSGHYENGNFEYLMEIAKELGVAHVMLLHPKAAGAWLQGRFPRFSDEELLHIKSLVKKYNRTRKLFKHPSITAQIIEEDSEHYGCAAGGTDRFYINAKGDVQPCEFLNISFGNIYEEKFIDIFTRMREEFNTPGTTWLCEAYSDKVNNQFRSDEILPLNLEESKKLYSKWDRGDATPLYYKIEKELIKIKN